MSESSVLMMQQPKKGQMSQNDGLIKYKCGDIIREQVTGSQQCPTLSSIPGASFVSRVQSLKSRQSFEVKQVA